MTSPVFSHTDTGPEHGLTPEERAAAVRGLTGGQDVAFLAAEDAPERDEEHTLAVPAAAPPAPPDAPQPLFAGTYAVYDDQRGGAVLVLGQDGGDTIHKHIPAAMLKMAEKFGGGGLAGIFGGA